MASPGLSEGQIEEHNRLWKEATSIAERLISLGTERRKLGWVGRRRARRALAMVDRCAQLAGDTWNIRWQRGKLWQVLGGHDAAIEQFLSAAADAPDRYAADMWREACLEALDLGRGDVAVRCAECAIQCRSGEAGLYANLALAHVLARDDTEAARSAERACAMDPADEVSQNVRRLVLDVASGRRARPSKL